MIGDRLKLLRKEKELTQQDVAKVLDVSRSTYTQYETGKSEPDLATVDKLAEFFEASSDYLLGRTDIKNPPETIAAHHDRDEWTEEELEDIEQFKAFIRDRRKKYGEKDE